jgi:hypothetical protein
VQELETGPLHRFRDWPNEQVPKRPAGHGKADTRLGAPRAWEAPSARSVPADPTARRAHAPTVVVRG